MTIEQDIFTALIAQNAFNDQRPSVQNYAQLAIDKGYAKLSSKQQAVVSPFLQRNCEGVKDQEQNHNNCQTVIGGQDLVAAAENSGHYEGWLCESCRGESDQYGNKLAKAMA